MPEPGSVIDELHSHGVSIGVGEAGGNGAGAADTGSAVRVRTSCACGGGMRGPDGAMGPNADVMRVRGWPR